MTVSNRPVFDQELRKLQDELLRMGSLLDKAIENAVTALRERDQTLARQVIAEDNTINNLRFQIEEHCVRLIATQQPMAGDLRMIVAAMNIVVDMERMADHAAGIAKNTIQLGHEPLLKPLIDLPLMADHARRLIKMALDAFVARDVNTASRLGKEDDVIDALYHQILRELVTYVSEDPKSITRALYLLFAAHNLERIADRAVNIGERVIFITSGEMRELSGSNQDPISLANSN